MKLFMPPLALFTVVPKKLPSALVVPAKVTYTLALLTQLYAPLSNVLLQWKAAKRLLLQALVWRLLPASFWVI